MKVIASLVLASTATIFAAVNADLAASFTPPAEFAGKFGPYKTLLQFNDGSLVSSAVDWSKRRQEILDVWREALGPWPPLLPEPRLVFEKSRSRDGCTEHQITVEIARGESAAAYLLIPKGQGPFPAVLVPYYDPETSVGLGKQELRDFGYQLARRGFVTLSIGSPGGDARKPDTRGATCQPLAYLGYVAANCHTALARLEEVDPARIGIVGHSYGGKWAMFGACFYEKFACGVWSDPGIVFDESRPNVNYWEPWYLGSDPARLRRPGIPAEDNPRTGAYKELVASGHDLHEVLALMAPRPFLISGGSEDPPARWLALNRVNEVYEKLGARNRVGLTIRKDHTPTVESNEEIYAFFEAFLKAK